MTYKKDTDLEFLKFCSNDDLSPLVYCLTTDKDGSTRYTEELTSRDAYKRYYPDHVKYWDEIAGELQCYGSNGIARLFRGGEGVLYEEILHDVCKNQQVDFDKNNSIEIIEAKLLKNLITNVFKNISTAERKKIFSEAEIDISDAELNDIGKILGHINEGSFQSHILTTAIIATITSAMIGRGLGILASFGLGRLVSVLGGPVGIALGAGWLLLDLNGPAFRVTVPSVLIVSSLRRKFNFQQSEKKLIIKPLVNELANNGFTETAFIADLIIENIKFNKSDIDIIHLILKEKKYLHDITTKQFNKLYELIVNYKNTYKQLLLQSRL